MPIYLHTYPFSLHFISLAHKFKPFYSLFYIIPDPFLPYVVELSTTSSDRQTKIAACELLHSLVLYVLGRSVSGPAARRGQGASQGAPVTSLYKKVFPAILTLACDADQVRKKWPFCQDTSQCTTPRVPGESCSVRYPGLSLQSNTLWLRHMIQFSLFQVCRQLFEPLMFQLIHWFTGNKKYESEDTMMLLNALMVRKYE